jgi:G:T-mismatch repair DNA endonuclease (very short patch repair protein)
MVPLSALGAQRYRKGAGMSGDSDGETDRRHSVNSIKMKRLWKRRRLDPDSFDKTRRVMAKAQKQRGADPEERRLRSLRMKAVWRRKEYREAALKRDYSVFSSAGKKRAFRPLSITHKRNISFALLGNKHALGSRHKPLTPVQWKRYFSNSKPNKKEMLLNRLLQRHFPGEFRLNTQAGVVIGGKVPDFVNVKGKKILIEMFGKYWHGKEKTGLSNTQEEKGRKSVFSEYGFNTIIIWEPELCNSVLVRQKVEGKTEFRFPRLAHKEADAAYEEVNGRESGFPDLARGVW